MGATFTRCMVQELELVICFFEHEGGFDGEEGEMKESLGSEGARVAVWAALIEVTSNGGFEEVE